MTRHFALIACEKLRRQARVMELDPVYCDVALERLRRKFPKVEITHQQSGKPLQTLIEEKQGGE